jgi:hypothetical protein
MSIDTNRMLFDRRTLIRHMRAGRITEAQYTEFVGALPDAEANIRDADDGGDEDGYERQKPPAGEVADATAAAPVAPEPVSAPIAPPVVPPTPSVPSIDVSAPPPPPVPPLGHKS